MLVSSMLQLMLSEWLWIEEAQRVVDKTGWTMELT